MKQNEKKQIEEMADIINEMPERNAHYYVEENGRTIQKEAFADCYAIAEALYNAGYCKVDANAEITVGEKVVISRDMCDLLNEEQKELQAKMYIQANKIYSNATLESWKKEDLIKHIRTLEHNWSNAEQRIENQIQNFEKCVELKNKETAREILQWLVDTGLIEQAPDTTKTHFKEKYGVEVK